MTNMEYYGQLREERARQEEREKADIRVKEEKEKANKEKMNIFKRFVEEGVNPELVRKILFENN